jgi:hypothetical protein
MQAIRVKYVGPTDRKGSRWSVACSGGRMLVPLDNSQRDDGKRAAALALAAKLEWHNAETLVSGTLPDGSTVFVFPVAD